MNSKSIRSQFLESRHAMLTRPLAFVGLLAILTSIIGIKVIFAQSAVQPSGRLPAQFIQHRAASPAPALGGNRQAAAPTPSSRPLSRRLAGSLQANRSYGKLPLSFEPNRGQAAKGVRFVARGRGYSLAMSESEALLALRSTKQKAKIGDRQPSGVRSPSPSATEPSERTTDVLLRMELVGGNRKATITGTDELPGKSNYFIGADSSQWLTNIPNYARVRYHDVYPGVDLVYYGNEGQLEYDFVVAPGGDPKAIRLNLVREEEAGRRKAGGGKWLRIDRQGDLVVSLDGGDVRFRKPVVYQVEPSEDAEMRFHRQSSTVNRQYLPGRFVIDHHRRITYRVAAYDRSRPLVIDPSLTYSTYLGGSQADVGYGIAVDGAGNTYIAGQTCSTNFPTMGAEQTSLAGQCDAFVTKLNPTGTALVYSTYLGGSQGQTSSPAGNSVAGIAVDSSGDAYVTGITNATNFPTFPNSTSNPACPPTCPFQTAYGGGDSDAFITKLDSSGSALVYSTYLGGGDADSGNAIAVDSSGDAFVTGETYSNPFPTTAGAFQTVYGGRGDAFVTKLNPAGTALVYSTYLGAELQDAGNGIAVDDVGSAFVTGSTYSLGFPVAHAIQENCGGYLPGPPQSCPLARDAYVTKFTPDGSSLVYSTYLGGSKDDVGTGIALDSLGAAYVAGFTTSIDFPVRPDALQTVLTGTQNAFVTKVDSLGGAPFAYSTYLGGSGVDAATAIAVDSNEVAYVTGGTASPDFPTVSAIQPNLAGPLVFPGDAFVSKVNAFGSGLIYSSYLGGGNLDEGNGIAVDPSLAVYVTGSTTSSDFPIVPGSFQPTPGGAGDAFVSKFDALTAAVAELSPRNLSFPPQGLGIPSTPQTVTITNSGDAALLVSAIVETGDIYTPPPNPNPQNPIDLKDWDVTTDNCTGASVPPGSNCTFTVTFVPNPTPYPNGLGPGQRTGTITLTDNATSPTQVIQLSGQGVAPPGVTLLPTNLSFANQLSGTTSSAQTVTLSNSGGFVLAISSISVTSPFNQTNTCGTSLGAGGNCTISVTFAPTTSGPASGTININDDAAGSPQTVNLTGTGTAPVVTLSSTTLTFTSQAANTLSSPQSVTLTNSGTAPLNISGITLVGANSSDFSLTPAATCGGSVAAGASCAINVTFSPTAAGTRVAVVNIADNAQGSPQQVALSGVAILAPNVTFSETNVNFPSPQNVGTTSAAVTVTLTNTGSAPLQITGSATAGDFSQTNTCAASVAVGAKCSISVTFTPTAAGNRYGLLTLTDNAADSPQTVALAGTGLDFSIAATPPSISVPSGAAASYNVTISPLGNFTGKVTLSCANLPTGATCSATPGTVTEDGVTPVTAVVTVSTTGTATAPPSGRPPAVLRYHGLSPRTWLIALILLSAILLASAPRGRGLRARLALSAAVLLFLLSWTSCGGGGSGSLCTAFGGCSSSESASQAATPAGAYSITINGVSNTTIHSAGVSLVVH